jgi:hypothetical protein
MGKYDEVNAVPTSELPTLGQLDGILADKVHNKVYGKYDLEGIPKDLLNTCNYIKIQRPDGGIKHLEFAKTTTIDGNSTYTCKVSTKESKVEYVFIGDDPLWVEYQSARELTKAFNKTVEAHKETRQLYTEEVDQVLQGVNTTGQLLEQWPEILPYLPSNLNNPSNINLPSISVKKLNEQLK